MAYSDFDLRKVQAQFQLVFREQTDLFATTAPIPINERLNEIVNLWTPKALAMNTEKARSEFIIAPALMEITRHVGGSVNIFSGVLFDVDKNQGLNGACDFILTCSGEMFYIKYPVVTVFEAKKEDINTGLGQCLAAMVAAWKFNLEESKNAIPVYGVVTSGEIWKFLKLENQTAWIDLPTYHVNNMGKILAILAQILTPYATTAQTNNN